MGGSGRKENRIGWLYSEIRKEHLKERPKGALVRTETNLIGTMLFNVATQSLPIVQ
jgi:hypothetical protein